MGNRRLLCLLAALGVNYLLFQSILVPYGNGRAPWSSDSSDFSSMMKNVNIPIIEDEKSSLVFDGVSKLGVDRNGFHNVGKNNSLELDNIGSKKSFMAVLTKNSKVDFPVKRFSETKGGISTISQVVKSTTLNVTARKSKSNMPPKSRMLIQEMNHLLVRRRASSRAMVLLSLSIMNLLVAIWTSYCCGVLIISIRNSTFDCRDQGGHPNLIWKFLLQGRRSSMLLW